MKLFQKGILSLDELCIEAKKLTDNHICSTIYGAVGTLCDDVSITELVQWLSQECHCESAIRYYLQEQIAGAVINTIRYEEGVNKNDT